MEGGNSAQRIVSHGKQAQSEDIQISFIDSNASAFESWFEFQHCGPKRFERQSSAAEFFGSLRDMFMNKCRRATGDLARGNASALHTNIKQKDASTQFRAEGNFRKS